MRIVPGKHFLKKFQRILTNVSSVFVVVTVPWTNDNIHFIIVTSCLQRIPILLRQEFIMIKSILSFVYASRTLLQTLANILRIYFVYTTYISVTNSQVHYIVLPRRVRINHFRTPFYILMITPWFVLDINSSLSLQFTYNLNEIQGNVEECLCRHIKCMLHKYTILC